MRRWMLAYGIVIGLLTSVPPFVVQAEDQPSHRLSFVQAAKRDELQTVTSVVVSPDGRFVYASAYETASHVVLSCDKETGKLEHVQTYEDVNLITGATSLRLSTDGRFAVAAAFRSKAISLYLRDEKTGKLKLVDSKQQEVDEGVSGLNWTIEAQFSPDGKFVYALDDRGPGVTVFRLAGMKDAPKLEFVEAFQNEDLDGARGMVHHPSGKYVFATCSRANTLVALRRDTMSGKLSIVDVLSDEEEGVTGLASAFGVDVSKDGKFVYTVSGFRSNDNSVGVFQFNEQKEELTRVQEISPGDHPLAKEIAREGDALPFQGGNEVTLSPDQTKVYACATHSGSVAAFDRDQTTGKLSMVQLIVDKPHIGGAASLDVSPDNQFVYVAGQFVKAIGVYKLAPVGQGDEEKQ